MKNKYSRPEGTRDYYGVEAAGRRYVEGVIRGVCRKYGVSEVITPEFESAELFERNVGETTDVVNKEMYVFERGGGDGCGVNRFALRPEVTAGAARAYVQNGLAGGAQPVKWFYLAPVFRAERPQKGRYRQFSQFGVEYFGSWSPYADAEVMALFVDVLSALGVRGVKLRVNSLGGAGCRAAYKEILKGYISANKEKFCERCLERFERNPLRVLDCKNEGCAAVMEGAPASVDSLGAECAEHFRKTLAALDGLGVGYEVDKRIVRGLDYYTRTVFEFVSDDLGAQSAVGGGGRYDGLLAEVGAPTDVGAVGFGMGFERLMLILESQGLLPDLAERPTIYVGSAGERGADLAARTVAKLRENGVAAEFDLVGRSVKAQMKYADKAGFAYSAVIGDDEADGGSVTLKRMADGAEFVVDIGELAEFAHFERV